MIKTGVCPCSYVAFFERFAKKKLAPIYLLFNTFDEKHTSSTEYRHAMLFMGTLKLEKMREYNCMYLKLDTLDTVRHRMYLKASKKYVMSQKICFGLDLCHYTNLTIFPWDTMLKIIVVEWKLFIMLICI